MAVVKYYKWLDLKITHRYFSTGLYQSSQLVPFAESARILKNYSIILQNNNGYFSFYSGIPENETFLIEQNFSQLTTLNFQIITDDYLFFNYTDFPAKNVGQLFYFKNENIKSSLQKSEYVSGDDIVWVHKKYFIFSKETSTDQVVIMDLKGNRVWHDTSDKMNVQINMTALADGIYEIWTNEERVETFFSSSEELSESAIGIFQLDIEVLIQQNTQENSLSLDFNARAVYWQYQLIVPPSRNIQISEIKITSEGSEKYEGPTQREIVGGQIAHVFTSSIPLPLQERFSINPTLEMSYSDDLSNNKKELEIKLPNPSAENLSRNNREGDEDSFQSTTIVYV